MFCRILLLASLFLFCCTVSSFAVARSDIHSVDFRNFDYPEIPGAVNAPIHLANGHRNIVFDKNGPSSGPGNVEAGLESIHYGYWGASQIEVAVVVLWVSGGGSGISQELFVYSKVNSQLRLIWSFDEGGDRAAGGIRNVYFERSNLVVEINEQGPDDPRCCASHFTQRFFSRTGNKIRELRAQKGIPVTKR